MNTNPVKNIEAQLTTINTELNDIYQQMDQNNNMYQADINGTNLLVIGSEYASPLVDIDKFVHLDINTKDLAFDITKKPDGSISAKKLALARYYNYMLPYQASHSDIYFYSEHVELFFRCVKSLGLWGYPLGKPNQITLPSGKTDGELFNDLITLIREESKTTEFKHKLHRRIKNAANNYLSAKVYIDTLFQKYSKLLVIRIDPGYMREATKSISIKVVQKHIRKFFNNWRNNKLFENCVGYIWKLEMGDTKGFHSHMVLFFDGQVHKKDEFIAQKSSEYWNNVITKGKGHCFNSNQMKKEYERMNLDIGIGMIEHHDNEKREFLLKNIKYITKTDQYIKLKNSPKTRTFGRGAMPEIPETPLGRPRTKLANEASPNDSANHQMTLQSKKYEI